jgi:hypothetical protein
MNRTPVTKLYKPHEGRFTGTRDGRCGPESTEVS